MQKIKDFYRKYQTWIENGLFPVLLILYPFVQINQGIDVSDTAYSLSNFAFFGEMKGTWMTATFLANMLGSLLMKLPSGDTLLGIYCYTTCCSQRQRCWYTPQCAEGSPRRFCSLER